MFKFLQEKIKKAFQILKEEKKITEINVSIVLKEIGKALIDSDVNHKIVSNFIQKVKNKSVGRKVLHSLNPEQVITKIVYDELVKIMGVKNSEINISKTPSIILICGLQGSGKTSFSSKLSFFLKKKRKKNPLLVAADIYRPAAKEQLITIAKKIDIPVFHLENKNVIEIIEQSISFSIKNNRDVIIIDTAGRSSIDNIMMNEIKKITDKFHPDETLFVIDSMTGQDAINSAKNFLKAVKFNGVVITKLDGDSKGGVALTISSAIKKPIKFICNGEKVEDMEIFYPDRIANRILGKGDIVSFVEKIQEQFDEKRAKKIYKKITKNCFNFYDLLDQIKRIKKMGNLKNIISMIPGINNNSFFVDENKKENTFKKIETIIFSMTPYERKNPKIIINCFSRKKRVSNGSGYSLEDVNSFLKQFHNMSKIMKKINASSGKQIAKDFLSKIINQKKNFN